MPSRSDGSFEAGGAGVTERNARGREGVCAAEAADGSGLGAAGSPGGTAAVAEGGDGPGGGAGDRGSLTLRELVSRKAASLTSLFSESAAGEDGGLYRLIIGEVEGSLLEAVMRETAGHQGRAARVLGINRSTLRKKLREHGQDASAGRSRPSRGEKIGAGAGNRIRRALLSVSEKGGIEDFARSLLRLGVELVSTGGTARRLAAAGLPVTEVSALTGFPEIMAGRVKTLHPRVHGGLLGRRGVDDEIMHEYGIDPIDLVVVNLYPFERISGRRDCGFAEAMEHIDVGGPAMLRAAAKNHAAVTVVVDAADHPRVIEEMQRSGGAVGAKTRFELAAKAFAHTARYDAAIANFLASVPDPARRPLQRNRFPEVYTRQFVKCADMRYGENPHQAAAFYRDLHTPQAEPTAAGARLAQGGPLSFNNVADADAAFECVRAFGEQPACVIVKHANPCGAAVAASAKEAYHRALRTDPASAFGGIVAFNRPVDEALARVLLERQFVEVLVAPAISDGAMEVVAAKPALRVLITHEPRAGAGGGEGDRGTGAGGRTGFELRSVRGGILVQETDQDGISLDGLEAATRRAPAPSELADLRFAWRVARFVKSNAIVFARDGATVGVGAGQASRVHSTRIARLKAEEEGLDLRGAVMASDAFFPFRDGIDAAAEAGIAAVIQPGGSVRDREVIAAADEHGMAMVFTGVRHFRH